jgi:hypothetical protein
MKQPYNPANPPATDQSLADEQALLEHYRQHSHAQPTAAMDALILAAAAAQLSRAKPVSLNWVQRLHAWLFGSGHPLRWSLALGSLASIGLGLTLSLRSVEQLPPAYDLGAPLPRLSAAPQTAPAALAALAAPVAGAKMAPASAPMLPTLAAPMADNKAESSRAAPPLEQPQGTLQGAQLPAPASLAATEDKADARADANSTDADADAAAYAEQHQSQAALSKAKERAGATFAQQLQALLVLQRSGASAAAALELQRLQQRYPERDVAAELSKLQAGAR